MEPQGLPGWKAPHAPEYELYIHIHIHIICRYIMAPSRSSFHGLSLRLLALERAGTSEPRLSNSSRLMGLRCAVLCPAS